MVGELRNFFTHREVVGSVLNHAFFQCTGVYGSGERHVGDFLPPRKDQTATSDNILMGRRPDAHTPGSHTAETAWLGM
jgi:hypothetical protein